MLIETAPSLEDKERAASLRMGIGVHQLCILIRKLTVKTAE